LANLEAKQLTILATNNVTDLLTKEIIDQQINSTYQTKLIKLKNQSKADRKQSNQVKYK
jgi:hypothetical protein